MPRYTLFAPTGVPRAGPAPRPLTISVNDWQVKIDAEPSSSREGKTYVLTSIQHQAGIRSGVIKSIKRPGSHSPTAGSRDQAKKSLASLDSSQWIPEVDDQVLVAFEHGPSASHGALFLHPGPIARGSAQVQVDITAGAYRLRILKAGREPISIAAATAADAQISRGVKWEVLCGNGR